MTPPSQSGSTFSLKRTVAIPNTNAGGSFSFDIGVVDPAAQRYYLADRTNKSLDILDLGSYTLRQVGGFTGVGASSSVSGPDGVVYVPGSSTVYVGDVNNVMVVDASAGSITKQIPIGNSGFRTDEGCYDGDDGLVMFANPADKPPFATWISTKTNTVVAKLSFNNGSTGLEQCVYDPQTKNFFINNDSTTTNPTGELDVISAASVLAAAPTIASAYPEPACNPSGLAMGPNENLFVGCTPPNGSPFISLVMSATNGSVIKTVAGIGGEDEVAYDPTLNRYYTSSDVFTASVANSAGPFTPVLGVIDAGSQTLVKTYPTGNGSHSVAVDPSTGRVFVPILPTATAAGGIQVYGP